MAIDARVNDPHPPRIHTTGDQIVSSTLADGMESGSMVRPRQGALGDPHRRSHGPGCFRKRGGAEQVGNNSTKGDRVTQSQEQRKLVDVLYQNVRPFHREGAMYRAPPKQRKAVSAAVSFDADAVHLGPHGRTRPSGAHQSYPVPLGGQSSENFEQMNLGATGVRVGSI